MSDEKVTLLPAQMELPRLLEMEIEGETADVTAMVIAFDVAVDVVMQDALLVITQVTI